MRKPLHPEIFFLFVFSAKKRYLDIAVTMERRKLNGDVIDDIHNILIFTDNAPYLAVVESCGICAVFHCVVTVEKLSRLVGKGVVIHRKSFLGNRYSVRKFYRACSETDFREIGVVYVSVP